MIPTHFTFSVGLAGYPLHARTYAVPVSVVWTVGRIVRAALAGRGGR